MVKDTTYYDLLAVKPTATVPQIRKAYRLQALRHHPDRNGNTPDATAAFQHLKAVYEILSDPDRREEYDNCGPPSNLHSDDSSFDLEAVAAFFKRAKVTEEDIVAYERTYRDGHDERDDLNDFFTRMSGAVENVLEYIPYSDESDLVRFVQHWDACVESGQMHSSQKWINARRRLMARGKGKERQISSIEPTKLGTKKRKSPKKDDEMSALANLIRKRQDRGKQEFEQWCAEVEEKERRSTQKIKRGRRSSKTSQDKSMKARRQIKKKKSS